ncbi:SCO2521 family protein [Nocardia salmonicida]|uniref:SCO2521 family protein n=1 Tax=Nocardia salmonicida TaxID=53431 RepID=UPI002E2AD957|nr:SCO2521 family protein [Nocardia salmonicida]
MDLRPPVSAVLGEVRTGLLPAAAALSRDSAAELMALVHGHPVPSRERPVTWAQSPVVLEGIDCRLATPDQRRVRAVGTVAARAAVVGGRIMQSSARSAVVPAQSDRRQKWVHYLHRPGVVEVLTRAQANLGADLASGFLAVREGATDTFDPGAVAARLAVRVRRNPMLDQRPPLHTPTTQLRWAARVVDGAEAAMTLTMYPDELRTAEFVVGDIAQLTAVQALCDDIALHDWLLTVLTEVIDEAEMSELSRTPVEKVISPLLEHLVYLWMPGATTPPVVRGLWDVLEADPGFSRQWNARVGQLRDRLAVATLAALNRSTTVW